MMQIKDQALQRAELYEKVVLKMRMSERHVARILKQEILTGELPENQQEALEHLEVMKEKLLI